jgi:hypothetical protein
MREFGEGLEDEDEPWHDDDESDVVPCPKCGADVYEDAEQCPSCGEYIVHPTSAWHGKPWWWIAVGMAGITAVIWLSMP